MLRNMYKSMAAEELATYSQDMFFIYSFRGWWVKFLTVRQEIEISKISWVNSRNCK